MSFWSGLQDYSAGLRERMSGRSGPMSGFTDMQFGMNGGQGQYGIQNPNVGSQDLVKTADRNTQPTVTPGPGSMGGRIGMYDPVRNTPEKQRLGQVYDAIHYNLMGETGHWSGDKPSGPINMSLVKALKNGRGLFSPEFMSDTPQKYMRQGSVMPPSNGANTPTAYGDVSSAMAQPYSPMRPSGILQQTQQRVY